MEKRVYQSPPTFIGAMSNSAQVNANKLFALLERWILHFATCLIWWNMLGHLGHFVELFQSFDLRDHPCQFCLDSWFVYIYIYIFFQINVLALKLWVDFIWSRKSESKSRLKFKSGELHKNVFCNEMWNPEDHERNLLMGKNTYIRNVQISKDVDISQSKAVGYFGIIWCSTQDQILGWWGWTLRHFKKPAKTHQSKGSGSSCKFLFGVISLDKHVPLIQAILWFCFGDFSVVKAWKQKSCVKLQPS